MTTNTDDDNIEIIPDPDAASADSDDDQRSATDLVQQPAKVMRIGTMIKQLLEEVRPLLDEASRNRLREIHATSIRELEDGWPSNCARSSNARPPALRTRRCPRTPSCGSPRPSWSAGWSGLFPRDPDSAVRPADGGIAHSSSRCAKGRCRPGWGSPG